MHQPWKSDELRISNNLDIVIKGHLIRKLEPAPNALISPASKTYDTRSAINSVKYLCIIKHTIHASMVKIGPLVIEIWSSKSTSSENFTSSKNLTLLQHPKPLAQIQHPRLWCASVSQDVPLNLV